METTSKAYKERALAAERDLAIVTETVTSKDKEIASITADKDAIIANITKSKDDTIAALTKTKNQIITDYIKDNEQLKKELDAARRSNQDIPILNETIKAKDKEVHDVQVEAIKNATDQIAAAKKELADEKERAAKEKDGYLNYIVGVRALVDRYKKAYIFLCNSIQGITENAIDLGESINKDIR